MMAAVRSELLLTYLSFLLFGGSLSLLNTQFDTNGDGAISLSELREAMKKLLGQQVSVPLLLRYNFSMATP